MEYTSIIIFYKYSFILLFLFKKIISKRILNNYSRIILLMTIFNIKMFFYNYKLAKYLIFHINIIYI